MKIGALVALYGEKSSILAQLISECQAQIVSVLGSAFHPYDVRQVHATIVGLGILNEHSLINDAYYQYRGQQVPMDLDSLLRFLRGSGYLPLQIQIGGFQNRDYPFASRGLRPYERSFTLGGGVSVLMGWPIRGTPNNMFIESEADLIREARIYPNTLDEIRQAAQSFGILHRYYRNIGDVDNDFYFRIGLYDQANFSEEIRSEIEDKLCQYLGKIHPILIEVSLSDVYIVISESETYPVDSTMTYLVSDLKTTGDSIKSYYLS
jgi:hypothetical protein